MRNAAWIALFTAALAVAFLLRRSPGEPLDSESAYRLRLAELTLATGTAPETDRFLAHPAGARVPFPSLLHGSLAALARVLGPRLERGAPRRIDEEQLLRLARGAVPWLGLLAAGLAYLAVRGLPGAGLSAAALAALVWATLPQVVAPERVSRFDPHALVAGLCFAQMALLRTALRGRELSDVTLAALGAGLLGGLAMLADVGAVLFELTAAAALARVALSRSGRARSDAWRATLLFTLTASVVTILPPSEHGPRAFALLPPLAGSSMIAGWADAWLAWLVFPLAWVITLREAREPERAFLATLGPVALLAASLDARYAVVFAVALVPTLGLALATLAARGAGWVALALLVLAPAYTPWLEARSEPAPEQLAIERGLRWLRDHSPAPGPFNHPDARQDWCVLTAPSFAGLVVFHARRPVAAASFDGVPSPRATAAARALLSSSSEDLERAMRSLGAGYLVVSPLMLDDPTVRREGPRSEGVLHHLALPPENAPPDHYPGFELVYASNLWVEGGPALSIYRRALGAAPVPSASSAEER